MRLGEGERLEVGGEQQLCFQLRPASCHQARARAVLTIAAPGI